MRFLKTDAGGRVQRLDLHYRYREDHTVFIDGRPARTTPALEERG